MAVVDWSRCPTCQRIEHIKRRMEGITKASRFADSLDVRRRLQAEFQRLQRELARLQG